MTQSALLTVQLEAMTITSDTAEWEVTKACLGTEFPEHFGAGFLHPPHCACITSILPRLCDVGWLEEYIQAVGVDVAFAFVLGETEETCGRIQVTGRLVSESYSSPDYGVDYDERFEPETTTVQS